MVSLRVKEQHPNTIGEERIMVSLSNEQENAQKLKSSESKQIDNLSVAKTVNNSDITQLLDSYQKMRAEEQRLAELKQQILTRQQDLQNTLVMEMEKMKVSIAGLSSEIPDLESKTRKLGEALGIENRNEDELAKTNSSTPVTKGR